MKLPQPLSHLPAQMASGSWSLAPSSLIPVPGRNSQAHSKDSALASTQPLPVPKIHVPSSQEGLAQERGQVATWKYVSYVCHTGAHRCPCHLELPTQ